MDRHPRHRLHGRYDAAHLTATNGDALTVQLSNPTLVVQTGFGKTELPVKLIRSIKVSAAKSNGTAASGAIDGNGLRLAIVLRDGSRLVGKGTADTLTFHSTAMGDLKFPWSGIRSLVYASASTDSAQLTAKNGDVYEVSSPRRRCRWKRALAKMRYR